MTNTTMKTTMKDREMEEARNAYARTASLIRIAQFGSPTSMAAFYYLAEEQRQRQMQKEATGVSVSDNETNTNTEPVNDQIDWFDCNIFRCGGQEFVNED